MAIEVRLATPSDLGAILDLLDDALGWVPDDQHAAFFRWKHRENPFGESPAWLAEDEGRVVGYRTFLRWEWDRDGKTVRAVRAVDTATHPTAQGRGVFRALTTHAIDALKDDGVAFIFNTPNTLSRPGYLNMGWIDVGRPRARLRPRSPASIPRMLRARVPAEKWSVHSEVGLDALDALADDDAVEHLLRAQPPLAAGHLRTRRTPAFLRWRYGFAPLAYRAMPVGDGLVDGVVVFRVRRRGASLEATIVDVLAPPRSGAAVRHAVGRILRECGADHAIALGPERRLREGLLAVPNLGPRLTWRALCETAAPPPGAWALGLGDLELF